MEDTVVVKRRAIAPLCGTAEKSRGERVSWSDSKSHHRIRGKMRNGGASD